MSISIFVDRKSDSLYVELLVLFIECRTNDCRVVYVMYSFFLEYGVNCRAQWMRSLSQVSNHDH